MQNVGLENMNHRLTGISKHETVGYRLNEEQKGLLEDILSKYDPDNFSNEDKRSMRLELKEAGIYPGQELGTALKTAGFEISPPHPPHGKAGGPPPNDVLSPKLSDNQKQILEEILSKYDPNNFTEEDNNSLQEELEAAEIFPGRELGAALNKVGFDIRIYPQEKIPSGIIVDNKI